MLQDDWAVEERKTDRGTCHTLIEVLHTGREVRLVWWDVSDPQQPTSLRGDEGRICGGQRRVLENARRHPREAVARSVRGATSRNPLLDRAPAAGERDRRR